MFIRIERTFEVGITIRFFESIIPLIDRIIGKRNADFYLKENKITDIEVFYSEGSPINIEMLSHLFVLISIGYGISLLLFMVEKACNTNKKQN